MKEQARTTHGDGEGPLPEVFDDPGLESAFGLTGEHDWIERARLAESPAAPLGRLGHYELIEEVGRGGQGVVYKAVQPGMGRTIAIKRLSTGLLLGTKARARFAQEVQALARLRHPSIITVYGAEVINGSPVLLMEYVAGTSIDHWSDGAGDTRMRRPIRQVLAVFAKVCDAVTHAHQRGVIHRDIKPSNVLVDEVDVPRILDFGIARLVDDWHDGIADPCSLTGFAGTPAHAAPEQLDRSAEADTRSDVYSLGVLLYRMVTGVDAFERDMPLPALIDAVQAGRVRPPSQACSSAPRELDLVIGKAMDPDPARRYQTVESLADDVGRFLRGEPVLAHPPSRAYQLRKFVQRHRVAGISTSAAVIMIVALGGVAIAQAIHLTGKNQVLGAALEREANARREADTHRASAQSQAESLRASTSAMADMVGKLMDRLNRVTGMTKREGLDIIKAELDTLKEPSDGHAAALFHILHGRFASATGHGDESLDHWQKANDAAASVYSAEAPELARVRVEYARQLVYNGRAREAIAVAVQAMRTTDRPAFCDAYWWKCNALETTGQHEAALAEMDRLMEEVQDNHSIRALTLELRYQVLVTLGRPADARLALEQAITEAESTGASVSFDAARLRVSLANVLLRENKPAEAEATVAPAVAIRLKHMGPLHVRTQDALQTHAEALSRLGRFAEAAQRLEQANARIEARHAADSRPLACHRFRLAAAHLGAGAQSEGRRNLALTVSLGKVNDPDDPAVAPAVLACEAAIARNSWQVDAALAAALGELAWLVDAAPAPAE